MSVPLIELRGWVTCQGVKIARTPFAQPYPPLLAVAFGDLLADALQHRALASSEGRPRPMAAPEQTFGHPVYGLTWEHPLLRASAGSGSVPSFVPRGNGAPMGLSQHETSPGRVRRVTLRTTSWPSTMKRKERSPTSLPMKLKTLIGAPCPGEAGDGSGACIEGVRAPVAS